MIHGCIGGGVEGIDVWLGYGRTGKTYEGACTEREDRIGCERQAKVGFHRSKHKLVSQKGLGEEVKEYVLVLK